jgi:hypothetical protein
MMPFFRTRSAKLESALCASAGLDSNNHATPRTKQALVRRAQMDI